MIEEGLALYRELGDKEGIATSIVYFGFVAVLGQRTDVPMATLLEEATGLKPELRERRTVANLLVLEGLVALGRGDLERAVALNEESLVLYREVSDVLGVVTCLTNIGFVVLAQDDYERSATLLREGLRLAWGWITSSTSSTASSGLRAWPLLRAAPFVPLPGRATRRRTKPGSPNR